MKTLKRIALYPFALTLYAVLGLVLWLCLIAPRAWELTEEPVRSWFRKLV